MNFLLRSSALAVLLSLPSVAIAQVRAVNVVVQLTADGKKVSPPAKESPAYYYPMVAGYTVEGAPMAGEKEPPQLPILQKLAVELANQNYFVATDRTPAPSVMLVFNWGIVNPLEDVSETFELPRTLLEEQQADRAANPPRGAGMAVAGMNSSASLANDQTGTRGKDESRYLVVVSAFDYQSFLTKKKKVLLWKTIMSVPMAGTNFIESYPRLITEGAAWFGREKVVSSANPAAKARR
jgi:hypothetical protein